jgi:hypothetical protein
LAPIHPLLVAFSSPSDNPEGLNCGDLVVGVVPELANGLRLGTVVPSQYLSGARVTVHG